MRPIVYRGWVYGIQSGQFIKIGFAYSIARRLREMRLYNPHPLKVVLRRRCESPRFVEQRMHTILKPRALGREWFDVTPEQAREAVTIALQDEDGRREAQIKWENQSGEIAEQRAQRLLARPIPNPRIVKRKLQPRWVGNGE
jgi:hypothetical protein